MLWWRRIAGRPGRCAGGLLTSPGTQVLRSRPSRRSDGLTSLVRSAPGVVAWYWAGIAACYLSQAQLRQPAARLAIKAFGRVLNAAPGSADTLAWVGRAHMRNRDWVQARKSWLSALDIDPGNRAAQHGLDRLNVADARKCLSRGEAAQAIELLHGVVDRDPGNVEAIRLGAWAFALVGNAPDARERLDALIRLGADDVDSYVRVGQCLRKTGALDDAAALFRIVLKRDPGNRRARIFLARTIEKSEPDEAVTLWEGLLGDGLVSAEARQVLDRISAARQRQAAREEERRQHEIIKRQIKVLAAETKRRDRPSLEVDPENGDDSDAEVTIESPGDPGEAQQTSRPAPARDETLKPKLDAVLAIEQRSVAEADQAYIDLWLKHGDVPDLLRAYGDYQLRRKNLTASYELFRRLADDFANGPYAYRQMARIQRDRGKPDRAERLYLDGMVEFDDTALVLDYAGFLVDTGRVQEAIDSLRRLDWDVRGAVPAYRKLARDLVQSGHPDSALRAYEVGIERFPQAGALYRDHAKLLNERGRFAAAVAVLERLVALRPSDPAGWSSLVYLIARAERHAEAENCLARARSAIGGSFAGLCALGRIAERSLMHEAAEALFRDAIEAYPADARSHAEFGAYFVRQGALRSALRHLSRAVALDPGNAATRADLDHVKSGLAFLDLPHDDADRLPAEILVPESLFAVVGRIHEASRARYQPRPGHVMIVTSSLTAGGAERQAANTVSELVRAHPRVASVALGAASLSARRRRNFYLPRIAHLPIEIVSLEDMAIDHPLDHPEVAPFAEILGYFTADIRPDIARWIIAFSAQRPAVVHTWQDYINIAAGTAALLLGVPRLVMGTRNTRPDNKYRRLKRYMHTAYREMVKLPSVGLINNSIAGARDYEAWLGLNEGDCGVIWNGLNLASLTEQAQQRAEIREKLGIPEGAPVMGGVFRMSDEKRPMLWLETAAIVARAHPDAHFIMCGDGVLYADARDYAEALGLGGRVHLPGMISNIGAWYDAMSIFLLASRKEGLPNVLIEAQAFGMPVVSSNVGGAAEVIIPAETGFVVDDADADTLAERILWCLARPDWLAACKEKAPGFVHATFSLDAMAGKTLAAYRL